MIPATHLKPELVCRQCGRPEAHAVGDEILCAACYHERGSCGAVREAPDSGDQVEGNTERRTGAIRTGGAANITSDT